MAYIYCADIYCDDCGKEICNNIKAEGNAPEDANDETFDSDEYPKYCDDDSEADCPQHCGSQKDCINFIELEDGTRVGCLISTNLTAYGTEYVKEAIEEAVERGESEESSVALAVWAKEFSLQGRSNFDLWLVT